MFIGASLGEGPDEPLSQEEIDKRLAVHYESEEKMYAKLSKILARFAVNYEKSLKEKRKPPGMPDLDPDEHPAPMSTFAERRAAREAAREEAQRVAIERAERRRELVQKFRWLREQTECDWCGTVAARLEFAQLDRDEAGFPKENNEGFRNSCKKCAGGQVEADVD